MNLEILGYQLNNVMICCLIIALGVIYFYFFKKRNDVIDTCMIMGALLNYIQLIIVIAFVVVGTILSFYLIKDALYIALIIPLGWYYISYNIIKKIFIIDFKIPFKEKKKKTKSVNPIFVNIALWFMLSAAIIIGLTSTFMGLKDIVNKYELNKTYVAVTAIIIETEILNNSDGVLYKPVYQYIVNGKNYTIKPNYSSGIPNKIGSTRTIKYNPLNPNEAFIDGSIDGIMSLLFGFMFTFIPMIFLLFLSNLKCKEKVMQYLVPSIFGIIGIGIYYFIGYEANSYDPIKLFLINPLAIIPLIFIVIAIISIYSILTKKVRIIT